MGEPSGSPDRRAPALWVAALTAAAYAAAGAAALLLAGPPGYASPLYPPAGIALVALLVYGRAALPGVWLGSFVVNAALGALRGQDGAAALLLPALIAAGAALQAAIGAWLVQRSCGRHPVLNEPRHVAMAALLGGAVACTLSPSVATPALLAFGVLDGAQLLGNWSTWWLGDTLGVLIGAPVALAFVGQPAADWRPRRRTLAAPLLAALGVVALAVQQVRSIEAERLQAAFEHDAAQLQVLVDGRLEEATHALAALHSAALVRGGQLDAAALRDASAWWLNHGQALHATGYGLRVPVPRLAAFEAETRAAGLPDYRVFDRDGGADRGSRGEVMAVRLLEPPDRNAAALGVNSLSIPAARQALEATRDSGQPRVTAPFRLTQSDRDEPGVVFYQALYGPSTGPGPDAAAAPSTEAERRERLLGVVFITLRTEAALADLGGAAGRVDWCLLDEDPGAGSPRLAASPGDRACTTGAASATGAAPVKAGRAERRLVWGGRQYRLSVVDRPRAQGSIAAEAGLISLAGLGAVAMLGALLLVVTGHTRRTELAVAQGTERLRAEVAERRQAESAQRETRERLERILDNAPIGVVFLDAGGRILECNLRFAEMAGTPVETLIGEGVLDRMHPDDHVAVRQARRDLLSGQASRTIASARLQAAHQAGAWVHIRVIASAVRSDDGRVLRLVAVIEDVSDQLRLQNSERARDRAEAANRAKNEFLSRMSHELRTPLNAMIGFAQLLGLDRDPSLAQHQSDWVQQIQRAGWHLLELINDTLDLSRIEAGAVALKLEPIDLPALVHAALPLVEASAAERGIVVEVQVEDGLPAALGDAVRLRQVLINLLSNAVKYNRAGGAVNIRLDHAGGAVQVAVTDTGLGMDVEQRARLFQPYDRLGRETSGIDGTGIGLVIAQRLLELMGGSLQVASRLGQGSTFSFSLPASAEAAALPADAPDSMPAPYAQRRVHYIEDNSTNIEVMRGILLQRPQVSLAVSTLGLDGLAAVRHEPPDLILLDMQLPDISGPELLRFLKNDDVLAKIPVIVVSADATPDHMRAALTLGAVRYLTKPLDVAAFLAQLDEVLEGMESRWAL